MSEDSVIGARILSVSIIIIIVEESSLKSHGHVHLPQALQLLLYRGMWHPNRHVPQKHKALGQAHSASTKVGSGRTQSNSKNILFLFIHLVWNICGVDTCKCAVFLEASIHTVLRACLNLSLEETSLWIKIDFL